MHEENAKSMLVDDEEKEDLISVDLEDEEFPEHF
jgi:hypothetical protein